MDQASASVSSILVPSLMRRPSCSVSWEGGFSADVFAFAVGGVGCVFGDAGLHDEGEDVEDVKDVTVMVRSDLGYR